MYHSKKTPKQKVLAAYKKGAKKPQKPTSKKGGGQFWHQGSAIKYPVAYIKNKIILYMLTTHMVALAINSSSEKLSMGCVPFHTQSTWLLQP